MRKGWRWAALGLLLVAVGLLGWQARRPEPAVMAAPAPSRALAPEAAASAQASRPSAAALVAQAAAASKPGQPQGEVAREFIEVCGVGRVRRSELEAGEGRPEPAWSKALNRLSEQGMPDVLKRLEAGSLRQRVAAAVLRGDVQAAAQMASPTDDVRTYRLALRACRKDAAYRATYPITLQQRAHIAATAASGFEMPDLPPPGPLPSNCAAINLERLELLDPGDAWPWMVRLNDAVMRADEVGINQALYQVAQRSRLSANTRALSATVAEVVGADLTVGEAWAMVTAMGTDAASLLDGMLVGILRPCRADALKDANRRQLCEQVVRRMPGMLAEAADASALHSLEERLGLKHSPEALSREDMNRGLQAMIPDSNRWMAEPSCANFAGLGQQLVKLAREGELVSIRAYLKASPASAPR